MALVVGIDEAGYGPLLGPLILASSQFQVPDSLDPSQFWAILHASVSHQKRRLAGRLLITDSKKAYTRGQGLGHLERTTLAVLQALGLKPQNLHDLLLGLCPESVPHIVSYAWYQDLQGVTLPAEDPDKAVAASAWRRDLERQQITPGPIRVACLDVGRYNHLVEAVRNKSNVLFSAACGLIQKALAQAAESNFKIVVDRQGGRVHYREPLLRMFPQMALSILSEDERCSRYRMESAHQRVELIFKIKADRDYLPVSLASMVAKYVRELLVDCINRHFQGYCPELKPTAGYWQDGQRFIRDLKALCPQVPLEHKRLVRCR